MTHPSSENEGPAASTDDLGERLSEVTRWPGPAPALWRNAVEAERLNPSSRRFPLAGALSRARSWSLAAAVVLTAIGVIAVVVPNTGKVRSSPSSPKVAQRSADWQSAESHDRLKADADHTGAAQPSRSPAVDAAKSVAPDAALARHVVRKASIDLVTPDVRATFAKLNLIPFDALGEFVETSSLSGEEKAVGGTITLRVTASRLSEVLGEIRALGKVTSESAGGQDVTDRVVDVQSRLRNEQRVEDELLELLASRKEAPLEEVLQLRESIARVREGIEQLTAQRDQLSRLVSLATVLVVVRPEGAAADTSGAAIGDYFLRSIDGAWSSGLRALANTCAWLVRVAVGGLVWWLILGVVAVSLRAAWRRAGGAAAREPVPTG